MSRLAKLMDYEQNMKQTPVIRTELTNKTNVSLACAMKQSLHIINY